jgi:hypothetical protein
MSLEDIPGKDEQMNWFKNLNAAPRLMISFGTLIILTLGIGYLSITNLSRANDRLGALYQEDMLGAMRVNDIAVARAMNGRSTILRSSPRTQKYRLRKLPAFAPTLRQQGKALLRAKARKCLPL